MKLGMTAALALAGALMCPPALTAQQPATPRQPDGPLTEDPRYNKSQNSQKPPANSAAPRSDDESSSNQTRIDLSPPKGESPASPGDDVREMHEWNPMRAIKDIEVGDFYYKRENYKAALSRYREALEFKPHDAVATFKLAQTLEMSKQLDEARARYEEYLAILKDGPSAPEATKALQRLKTH
jgi:tetratricopeptide (TPR) repeat protein